MFLDDLVALRIFGEQNKVTKRFSFSIICDSGEINAGMSHMEDMKDMLAFTLMATEVLQSIWLRHI
jgi:hypothetical protein